MTALLDVSLGTAEPVDQKIPQALFRAGQILGRIHRPEHIVFGDPGVEGRHHAGDPCLAKPCEDVVFLHKSISL